eukprot:scaffold2724_cov260-Pinguiococcus_pyrenoidosus.AAC.7
MLPPVSQPQELLLLARADLELHRGFAFLPRPGAGAEALWAPHLQRQLGQLLIASESNGRCPRRRNAASKAPSASG